MKYRFFSQPHSVSATQSRRYCNDRLLHRIVTGDWNWYTFVGMRQRNSLHQGIHLNPELSQISQSGKKHNLASMELEGFCTLEYMERCKEVDRNLYTACQRNKTCR